jgi:hypothetical protein
MGETFLDHSFALYYVGESCPHKLDERVTTPMVDDDDRIAHFLGQGTVVGIRSVRTSVGAKVRHTVYIKVVAPEVHHGAAFAVGVEPVAAGALGGS